LKKTVVYNMTKKLFVLFINFYKNFISPFLGYNCRFYPSCSEYTKQALIKYGAAKGAYLGLKRLLRCNPFFTGGYDPIPEED